MITVHGRTRAQGFSGLARLEPIAAVRAALPRQVPVVGNGDVKDVAGYLTMKAATGCDGVMIGRGAMGNPWIFRSLAALSRGEPDPGSPTLAERWRIWRRHADLCLTYAVDKMRVHELRKTLAWYSRGLRGGSHLRQSASATIDVAELQGMGHRFFAELVELEDRERTGGVAAADAGILTSPATPVSKAIARNLRRGARGETEPPFGAQFEAEEPCLPSSIAAAS
jgi:tRNA-dihydrouridine synthase